MYTYNVSVKYGNRAGNVKLAMRLPEYAENVRHAIKSKYMTIEELHRCDTVQQNVTL
jgi:hypothetical protein